MGFLFVDRIDALDEHHARGHLDLRPGHTALPPWLVLEAIGQLAAWVAMARTDFASRPVAALVGEARLGATAWRETVGGSVELTAHLERLDGRAVLYSGAAVCGDRQIATLTRCVGPLLPVALFDDPEVVRQRLATLRSGGGAPHPVGIHGEVQRRRVFPATLLAAALDALAAPAAEAALGGGPARAVILRDYKVRAFSEPGQVLDIVAEPEGVADGLATVRVSAVMDGKRTASGRFDYRVEP